MSNPLEFELTTVDRRHLVDMLRSPGYRVLDKIAAAYIDAAREAALAISMNDPLGNRDAVVSQWAYVMMAETFRNNLNKGIEFECLVLQQESATAQAPADVAKLRRQFAVLGELDEPSGA